MGWKDFFRRGNKIVEANAQHGLDKLEDPVIMTKQGIRDLKSTLDKAFQSQAKIKSMAIRLRSQETKLNDDATAWTKKANLLQDKIENKELDSKRGETLLIEALNKVENATTEATKIGKSADAQDAVVDKIAGKIKDLRTMISDAESELSNLEVRAETAKVSKDVNKELNDIGVNDSTRELLTRMKKKVEDDEALATAYEEMGDGGDTTAEEIDKILAEESPTENNDLLASFRSGREKKETKKPATKKPSTKKK